MGNRLARLLGVVVLSLLVSGAAIAGPETDGPSDATIPPDFHIKRTETVEDGTVQMEVDLDLKRSRGASAGYTKYRLPILLRIDTGRNTELRIITTGLQYQRPTMAFNDVAVGMKWTFEKGNPSWAIIPLVEFPTGSGGPHTPGLRPSATLVYQYELKKWEFIGNLVLESAVDSSSVKRYFKVYYTASVGYHFTDANQLSAGIIGETPNQYPGGIHEVKAFSQYLCALSKTDNLDLLGVIGLSAFGVDWQAVVGVSHRF